MTLKPKRPQVEPFEKGKKIASESPKKLEDKKCFKCHGFRHFRADCSNKMVLTLRKVKEIQVIEDEPSEEEDGNDVPALVTSDVGELLLIKTSLHVTMVLMNRAKVNKSLIQDEPFR